MAEKIEKNLEINEKNSQHTHDVLNNQPQLQVPVEQTAVLDNKTPKVEEKTDIKNGGHYSESIDGPSALEVQNAPIQKKGQSTSPSSRPKIVKPSPASDTTQSMKDSGEKKKGSGFHDWEERRLTIKCLEGHNDLISSVDMDGSFLISGRFVRFNIFSFIVRFICNGESVQFQVSFAASSRKKW